jgi:chromosome segregation ATPase
VELRLRARAAAQISRLRAQLRALEKRQRRADELRASQKQAQTDFEHCRGGAERCRNDLGLAMEKIQREIVHTAEKLREDTAEAVKGAMRAVGHLREQLREEFQEAAKKEHAENERAYTKLQAATTKEHAENERAFANLASGLRALSNVFDEQLKDVNGRLVTQQNTSCSLADGINGCEISVSKLDRDMATHRASLEDAIACCHKEFEERLVEQSRTWLERLSSFVMRFEGPMQDRVKEFVHREISNQEPRERRHDHQDLEALEDRLDRLVHALHTPSGHEKMLRPSINSVGEDDHAQCRRHFRSALDSTLYVKAPLLGSVPRASSESRRRRHASSAR